MVKGSDIVFDVALRQAGAIRAQGVHEFLDFTKAFEFLTPLRLNGNRIAIAAYPGGEAVITTDLCQEVGFSIATVSSETSHRLREVSPPWSLSANPFDLGVCSQFHHPDQVYKAFLDSMANDDKVDCIASQIRMGGLPISDETRRLFLVVREKKHIRGDQG